MSKNVYWALGALAIVIIGFVALQIYLHIDLKNFNEELEAGGIKPETPETLRVVFSKEKPADVKGFDWVWHHNHWDLVPIGNPNKPIEHSPVQVAEGSNETPIEKVANTPKTEKVEPKTFDTILTYNEELLRTHPVKALKLEAEARGHWSAKFIPLFPPDDLEAQAYARAVFYTAFLPHDDPRWHEGIKYATIFLSENLRKNFSRRACDLRRIHWVEKNEPNAHAQLLEMGLDEDTDYPIKH